MSTDTKKRCNHVEEDIKPRRGPWTLEEDALLTHYIASHGEGRWDMLAKCSGLKRTGKSCRLRWLNYLKPDVKRGNLTLEEQILILELHSKWGNRWSKIAQNLPGRTDNEIKNYWRTRVQKQARQLKIDANSNKFRDVIQRFWMPRLLQKMKKSTDQSSYSTMNPQSSQSTLTLNQVPQDLSQPPPPPPQHGSSRTRETIKSLNLQESNSSSEKCTSPSITSDSMNINSQIPEISECLTSPRAFGNIVYNPFLKGCYNMDSNSYDMESFNLAPIYDCHVAESNWINDDMADNLWNIDELWQFRQLQEKGITHS